MGCCSKVLLPIISSFAIILHPSGFMFFIIKTFRKLIVLSSLMKWNSVCISAQQIITFTLKGRGYYDYQGEVISYRFLDVVNQNIQKILYQAVLAIFIPQNEKKPISTRHLFNKPPGSLFYLNSWNLKSQLKLLCWGSSLLRKTWSEIVCIFFVTEKISNYQVG